MIRILFLSILFLFFSEIKGQSQDSSHAVLIETTFGNIKVKLYNETPLHRDNFLKLVKEHFYDSLLFHRVIARFMIQGGDPDSKYASAGKFLGEGDRSYTIPAEFRPNLFHKRGALGAARNGDEENPSRASSGCQFYIVQGQVFTDSLLNVVGKRIDRMQAYNKVVRDSANKYLFDNLLRLQKEENVDSIKITKAKIDTLIAHELPSIVPHQFTEEERKVYTTIGGAPHLDGSYTVFGEVIEGMDVVDKIAASPRDPANRPLTDIRMKMRILK